MEVEKQLDDFKVKINLELEDEIAGILGYSGSGKTMTLKMLSGIVTPDKGRIVLNGKVLFDSERRINLKPQERNVGLMFQSYALFNHMTVAENIIVGMKCPKKEQNEKLQKYLKLFELEEVMHQKPRTLSGGQKQRTALARILAQEPEILLLDEPFSALDSHLIFTIEKEFKQALKTFKGTVIYISHNRHEIYKYCEKTAVMSKGQIVELKPTMDLFSKCETISAAQLTGCRNMTPFTDLGEGKIEIPAWGITVTHKIGNERATHVGMREGDLWLSLEREAVINERYSNVPVRVKEAFKMPDKVKLELLTESGYLFIYTCSHHIFEKIRAARDETLTLVIDKEKLLFLR